MSNYKIALFAMLSIVSCQKQEIDDNSDTKRYQYTVTLKKYTVADTLFVASDNYDVYTITIGPENKITKREATTISMNNSVLAHWKIKQHKTIEQQPEVCFGSCTFIIANTDEHGNGYSSVYQTLNFEPFPALDNEYITIVDFPYPGWNRFEKR